MLPNVSKKSGQLNISITPEQTAFINQLAKHRITGPELVRGLIDAASEFYQKNGWFSFPVNLTPERFQNPETTSATVEKEPAPPQKLSQKDRLKKYEVGDEGDAQFSVHGQPLYTIPRTGPRTKSAVPPDKKGRKKNGGMNK